MLFCLLLVAGLASGMRCARTSECDACPNGNVSACDTDGLLIIEGGSSLCEMRRLSAVIPVAVPSADYGPVWWNPRVQIRDVKVASTSPSFSVLIFDDLAEVQRYQRSCNSSSFRAAAGCSFPLQTCTGGVSISLEGARVAYVVVECLDPDFCAVAVTWIGEFSYQPLQTLAVGIAGLVLSSSVLIVIGGVLLWSKLRTGVFLADDAEIRVFFVAIALIGVGSLVNWSAFVVQSQSTTVISSDLTAITRSDLYKNMTIIMMWVQKLQLLLASLLYLFMWFHWACAYHDEKKGRIKAISIVASLLLVALFISLTVAGFLISDEATSFLLGVAFYVIFIVLAQVNSDFFYSNF